VALPPPLARQRRFRPKARDAVRVQPTALVARQAKKGATQ
jgi:hypothetical protein